MYLSRGINSWSSSVSVPSCWSKAVGGNSLGSAGATSLLIATRGARNEALSYGAAKKKTRRIKRIYPLPSWVNDEVVGLNEAEKLDIWKTVQYLGGKDPLQLLSLEMMEQLKDSAISRTYYIPNSVRDEMWQLWKADPIVNNASSLAIRFRLSRQRVSTILVFRANEEQEREAGLLNGHEEIDKAFDIAATTYLAPESDGQMLDDKILLRNRISKPHASQVPAEVNMRVLDRVLPVATRHETWENQLPKDYLPQPLLHVPSPNKLWKNDEPLKAAVRAGTKPGKSNGSPSEKTITRKLGHAFQTLEPNGKLRKATIWEARKLLGVLHPKRKTMYDPTLDATVEPIPDELAVENYKNSLRPDQIHLARFWRTLSKTWDTEQEELEAVVDRKADLNDVSSLLPVDLMSFEKDQYTYLHYVQRAVTKKWSGSPPGVRPIPGGPRTTFKLDESGNYVEVEDRVNEDRPVESGNMAEAARQKVKAKKSTAMDAVAGVRRKAKLPKATRKTDEKDPHNFPPPLVPELSVNDEEPSDTPVTYDTSGDIWRPEAKPRQVNEQSTQHNYKHLASDLWRPKSNSKLAAQPNEKPNV